MHSDDLITYHMSELAVELSPPGSIDLDDFESSALETGPAPLNAVSGRLRHIFANQVPEGDELDLHGRRGSALLRVNSYSRMMAAHTRWQLDCPLISTVPSYAKTMHHFTMELLNRHREVSTTKSETSSPHLSAQQSMLPSLVQAGLGQVTIDDAPVPPCPSPELGGQSMPRTMAVRGVKPRSTTQPVPRDFAMAVRDRGAVM